MQGRGGKAVWMRGASDPRTLLLSEKYLVNLAPNLFSINKSNWQDASYVHRRQETETVAPPVCRTPKETFSKLLSKLVESKLTWTLRKLASSGTPEQ